MRYIFLALFLAGCATRKELIDIANTQIQFDNNFIKAIGTMNLRVGLLENKVKDIQDAIDTENTSEIVKDKK